MAPRKIYRPGRMRGGDFHHDLDEIRDAAREFGHAIGAAGANVLVTLALLLGGKSLPARPTGGPA
jgi:hypothetical protein